MWELYLRDDAEKLVSIEAPRTKQLMRMRDGVMTYLYLTSVFFTSLERGAQRKKVSEREQGRGRESQRGKVWSKKAVRGKQSYSNWKGIKSCEKIQGTPPDWRSKRKRKKKQCIKELAECPFNAEDRVLLKEPRGVSMYSVWSGYYGRKLNSSQEQLSTQPSECSGEKKSDCKS